jgi:hypothetical protein
MEPAAHLDAQLVHPLDDRRSATHSTGGPIEGREKSIAQGLDLAAAKPSKLLADSLVVAIEQRSPAAVAELGCPLRRVDNVGEQHRRKYAVRLRLGV